MVWRFCYSLLAVLALPVAFLRLWRKGQAQIEYRHRWGERLGGPPVCTPHALIGAYWFHAVSLGEMVALWPTILHFLSQYPHGVYVTTMTPSGSRWLLGRRAQLPPTLQARCAHAYLPYDLPLAVQRVINRVRPRLCVIMETEWWWNWYAILHRADVPIALINARVSDQAYPRYQSIRMLTRHILQYPAWIAANSTRSCERLLDLGAPPLRTCVFGELKWDNPPDPLQQAMGRRLRQHCQSGQPAVLWTAGSTHPEEESIILQQILYWLSQSTQGRSMCFWVPRHPERFDPVWEQCQAANLRVARRSQYPQLWQTDQTLPPELAHCDVFLVDTLGELPVYYAASDWAFIGGTGQGVGGHNPLEALALGVPVVTGPSVFGIQETLRIFDRESVRTLPKWDNDVFIQAVTPWMQAPSLAQAHGESARNLCAQHWGLRMRLHEKLANLAKSL